MTDERREERVGDPAVDAAWRGAAREVPPARVDEAILAAARDAVRGRPTGRRATGRQPWWSAWQPLAAAASVIGLSFLLVQMLPRDEVPAPVAAPVPAASPAAAAESAVVTATPDRRSDVVPPPSAAESWAEPRQESREPAQPTPVAAAVEKAVADRAAGANLSAATQRMDRPAPAAAAPGAARQAAAEQSVAAAPTPEAWASRIAALHDAGDIDAAAAELRAFRASHADAERYLPERLGGWAASVTHDSAP
jgi:hypothetical protein